MYRLFVLFLVLSLTMPVFASRTVVTQTPYYNNYTGNNIPNRRYHNNTSIFHDINDLERYAFNRTFMQDNDRMRLERLEELAFGTIRQGDIYTRYDMVREAILTRPKPNYKTSLLRNISNYFNGQLTGFTPPVTSTTYPQNNYYSYPSGYGNTSAIEYDSPIHKGYKINNYGVGSSSGIHILD